MKTTNKVTLSKYEIEKIKQGVERIRQTVPHADLEMVIQTFNYMFGHSLNDVDREYAENLIKSEYRKSVN